MNLTKKLAGIVILIVLTGGGYLYLQNHSNAPKTENAATQQQQQDTEKSQPAPEAKQLDFKKISEQIKNSEAYLLDVRTEGEYLNGRFEGAINWSLSRLQAKDFPAQPKDKIVYVYCRSGNRSGQAAQILKLNGFKNVQDLGGIANVQQIGGKLIK